MKNRTALASGLICLLTLVSLNAQDKGPERPGLVIETMTLDWEQISLDILVQDVKKSAQEQKLENFEISTRDKGISIIYRDILFAGDSPQITADTQEKLGRLALVLTRFSDKILKVEGHSALVAGQSDDGTALSAQRALAVANVLSTRGNFPGGNIESFGWGDSKPIADNSTDAGRSLNRRVEISIVNPAGLPAVSPAPSPDSTDAPKPIDPAVWWKTLSSAHAPGYTVFVVQKPSVDPAALADALAKEGLGDVVVVSAGDGTSIVYADAGFRPGTNNPDEKTRTTLRVISETLGVDAQARVGGYGNGVSTNDADARQYNIGRYIARSTGIKPENTLVGDIPLAFSSTKLAALAPDSETDLSIDTSSATATGTTPATAPAPASAVSIVSSSPAAVPAPSALSPMPAESPAPQSPTASVSQSPAESNQDSIFDSLDLTAGAFYPWGRYGEFAFLGVGVAPTLNLKIPGLARSSAWAPFRVSLALEALYDFPNATSSVTQLWEADWSVSLGYRFRVSPYFFITPKLGYGGIAHVLSDYQEGIGLSNGLTFYDQMATAKLTLEVEPKWKSGARIGIVFEPGFRTFFEESYIGYALTAGLGVRFSF